MLRPDADPPTFDGGSLVPVVTYLLTVAVLSVLAAVSAGGSPSPVLGIGWGVFLVVLAAGAFVTEGVSPRSVLPPVRSVLPVVGLVAAFWGAYNLLAYGLALGGVAGFDPTPSRAAAHPLMYLAALVSSLLFTAIPEELLFRAYLQSRLVDLAGEGRRAVAVGVTVTAALFALFHLPRWFLLSGHGVDAALATRLAGLTLAGLAYGLAYALTRNLWLVALVHATMNQPPFLVAVQVPPSLHLLVGVIEYAAVVGVALLAVRLTESDGIRLARSRETASVSDD
jgi:membrane protease YdiL (CAAX protease family)